MFVWNHFTNDARVLRECSALVEAGYEVDLIAIHDYKNTALPLKEQRPEGFTVIRVRNTLWFINILTRIAELLKRNVLIQMISVIIACIVAAAGFFFAPILLIGLLLVILLILPYKLRILYLRSTIVFRMIIKGMARNYDIYHSNDLNTLPQGYLCSKILRLKKRKLVYDSHEVQTSRTGYDSKIYALAERFLVKRVDTMIVENHTRAKYSEQLYGFYPEVVHNYPIPVEPEKMKKVDLYKLLDIPRNEPILLYQGGIQIGRGLDKLIQATPLFERGVVVLIGDGKLKPQLQQMVREMNIEERVKFLPKVPLEDLLSYTRNAYLGFQVLNNVCFNHYSASSNKLFEYMMSCVPVVACSFPEIQRVVEGEGIGICVDSHDPRSIAQGVNYLLSHEEEYILMRENCKRARNLYNWQNEKQQLFKLYEHVS
jgi:glycosyltransferase involved in cell wall biosynthesis